MQRRSFVCFLKEDETRDDRDGTGQWKRKIRNKNAAISRLETGTTSPQGTASTQPYGLVAKASRFQPSGGTPKNVKNWTTFAPLGVPSLSSLDETTKQETYNATHQRLSDLVQNLSTSNISWGYLFFLLTINSVITIGIILVYHFFIKGRGERT